jgi:hypothetical protein
MDAVKHMNGLASTIAGASLALFACCTTGVHAQQQMVGAPPEASNMRLVGSNNLQARSAYQPTIHHQGDRWIAYIGHHGGTDDIPAPRRCDLLVAVARGTSAAPRIENIALEFLGSSEMGRWMLAAVDGR